MPKNPKYTPEFKRELVDASYHTTKPLNAFARDMGVSKTTLHRWRAELRDHGEHAFPGRGHQTPEAEELSRRKRELKQAQQERDILKKALAFFAQASP